jgi:hypothetical protein
LIVKSPTDAAGNPIIISTILLLGNISILLHNKHTWNFRLTLYILYITML